MLLLCMLPACGGFRTGFLGGFWWGFRVGSGQPFYPLRVIKTTMAEKLSDEEIQNILDTYDREGTLKATAEKTNHSLSTVEKYVKRNKETPEDADSGESGSVLDLSGGDNSLVDLTDQELMEMDPAEFIETFFAEFDDMGVRDSFIQMISNQARLRQQVPDEDQMSQRIQSHNSGIGNANDANAIAELYWAIAQRYLRARGLAVGGGMSGGGMGMMSGGGSGGDWVGAGQSSVSTRPQENENDTGDAGNWVGAAGPMPGRGQQPQQQYPQNGQQPQQGGGQEMAAMFQQVLQQQQQMMNRMMEQEEKSESDRLRDEIEDLKQELSEDDDDDNITDSLREIMELRQLLNEFDNSNDDDQMEQVVGTLQQQLAQLRQEIQSDDSGADMSRMIAQGENSQFGLLAALAQSGDVEPGEMLELAQNLGEVESDPKVAEKKYEKQIEEMRVEAEKEKWGSILDGAEQLASSLGSVVAGVDLSEAGDEPDEVEPEVTATVDAEAPEGDDDDLSPAERMVREAGGGADEIEPESDEVTPDTNTPDDEQAVLVVSETEEEPDDESETQDVMGERPAAAEVVEADGGPAVETRESEVVGPEEDDGDDEGEEIVCPYCGRDDFDTPRQMWGHKGSCPEKGDDD